MNKRSTPILITILVSAWLFAVVGLLIYSQGYHFIKPTGTTGIPSGGVLNLYGDDPTTLDPAMSSDGGSYEYIIQIFSGLVRLDENLEPVPDIARDWDLSKDGRTYTFHLRDNVKFHSGRILTAQDIKYSWERAASPSTGSQTAGTYLGDIVGVKEMLSGEATEISGVRVVNDNTLEVKLTAPKSYFLYKLSHPVSFVIDKNNVNPGEWWRTPIGTGPFKLKEWTENNRMVLEPNTEYHGTVSKLDSVVFHMLAGLPMNLYESGETDIAEVSLAYIDRVSDPAGPFYDQLTIVPELSLYYIVFNAAEPPFDDVNIRKAFSMALDKDKIISLIFRNAVEKAEGIVPPGIKGFNGELVGLDYDVAGAQELIRQSKYGDVSALPAIILTTAGEGGTVSNVLQAAIVQWWENLGVEVKIRQIEPDIFYYNLKKEKDEMLDMGWIADYPHQQNFLDVLFRTGSDINFGEYSNPEVDALLDQAAAELDPGRSIELYQQVEQKLVDDAACIPISFGSKYVLIKPYVKGYKPNLLGYTMLNFVSIER
jgi:oligopeptide transport system substrate-binding protein